MPLYEHVVISRQDISPQQAEALNDQLKALIEQGGGSVAKIAKEYDTRFNMAGVTMPMDLSGRTSYVVAPDGKVVFAYSNLDPSDHVSQTLAAVKGWRAKHP